MLSYKQFAKTAREYIQTVRISIQNSEKIAEVLFYIAEDFFVNENYSRLDDFSVKKKNIFESTSFKKYFTKSIVREIEKHRLENKNILTKKLINRAYYSVKDVYMQKKAMLSNKSRSSDIDLVLSVFDISSDEEISNMHVTIRALKDKLDSKTYLQLRKRAKEKFKSCRVKARYFLYVLSQIEEFECGVRCTEEQQQKEHKHSKTDISNERKDIEVSESDYKKYYKNEKLDIQTKYKLYLYRAKYADELKNTKLSRLTRDDLLFFIINTEKLVGLHQVLKIIRYADKNTKIKNPRGWLIERFSISRGRFYFLLKKSKSKSENHVEKEKHQRKEHRDFQKQKQDDSVYIREDLLYLAKKYSIPLSNISSYLEKLNLRGDVSIAVEQYITSYLWKHRIAPEEKQKLVNYAKKELKKFVTPPPQNEAVNYIKSIIRNKIREKYLTLTIEDKIRLFSQKQHSNLHQQYCDTS